LLILVSSNHNMNILPDHITNKDIHNIASRIIKGSRITTDDAMTLYSECELPLLGIMAGIMRRRINNNYVWYNRNFHLEPTNICIYNCKFCSYRRRSGDPDSWNYSHDEMMEIVRRFDKTDVTEVHIVGGVHPSHDIYWYGGLIKKIKLHRPSLHIKAFSAVELDYMIKKAGLSLEEGLTYLKKCGLDSIPGGGAEIFDESIREKICPEKTSSERWLHIHETSHKLGITSNATMLYGHLETYFHRIDHMTRLRDLQDKTKGFNAFIPLKYKKSNNNMGYLGEVSIMEDLRNYAVSRIFLDNIPHIKAYWPMTGKEVAQLSLFFGTDDLDGTIEDTTRIYSMAGAEDQNPAMSAGAICKLVGDTGYIPVERDSLYIKR